VQKSDINLSTVKKRLEHTEKRLSEVIAFFSRVASNPAVLAQMVTAAQQSQAYLAGAEARRKKRRADGDTEESAGLSQGQLIPYKPMDVASFFQNLLVSPAPEADVQEPDPVADHNLESHFNVDGGQRSSMAVPATERFTIQEHSSSADAGVDDSAGEGDADIQVPPELAGGIPSIGIMPSGLHGSMNQAASQADAATGSVAATPAVTSGNSAPQAVFAQPDLVQARGKAAGMPSIGAASSLPNPFSASIPIVPDPANMALDDIDVPPDLYGTIEEMFKGGCSIEDLPEFKDESWHNIIDEDFDLPPAPA
jgi:hypothetical protein